jgi:hypothetical protein
MFGSDRTATAAPRIIAIDVRPATGDGQIMQDHPPLPLQRAKQPSSSPLPPLPHAARRRPPGWAGTAAPSRPRWPPARRPPGRAGPPAERTHPWCVALLGRLRVERRANGDASSVMQSGLLVGGCHRNGASGCWVVSWSWLEEGERGGAHRAEEQLRGSVRNSGAVTRRDTVGYGQYSGALLSGNGSSVARGVGCCAAAGAEQEI